MVLFPYLITNKLGLGGTELGLANLALSGPSVVFLLLGGVVAERAAGKPLLMVLHLMAALPAFVLAYIVANDGIQLQFWHMIAYGVALGTVGAFMMPARDAILNEVVERRGRVGSGVTLQQGVAFATLAQFAAQIAGLILGGYADKATQMPDWLGGFGVGPIASWQLLALQGLCRWHWCRARHFPLQGPQSRNWADRVWRGLRRHRRGLQSRRRRSKALGYDRSDVRRWHICHRRVSGRSAHHQS